MDYKAMMAERPDLLDIAKRLGYHPEPLTEGPGKFILVHPDGRRYYRGNTEAEIWVKAMWYADIISSLTPHQIPPVDTTHDGDGSA
jgi:hypothetical protein